MKPSVCIIIGIVLSGQLLIATTGSSQSLDNKITFGVQNQTLREGLNELGKLSGFRMAYTLPQIEEYKSITIGKDTRTVEETLKLLLSKTHLVYKVIDKSILIVDNAVTNSAFPTKSQQNVLFGTVVDREQAALPGVNIRVKNTTRGTITDSEGKYQIAAEKGEILVFSYIGYVVEEIVVSDQSVINVFLSPNIAMLQEVAIVSNGYQKLPKERATGAFSYIDNQDLSKKLSPNILQSIEGMVPGMQVSVLAGDRSFDYNNTQKGVSSDTRTVGFTDYNITIRGTSTIKGESFPLLVVDGAVTEMDISSLNPDDVDNITILKDAAAASIWGVRAANGVIVINTKKGRNNQKPQVDFTANYTVAEKPDLGYLKTMTSTQQLGYEKELVDRGFLYSVPANSYYNAQYLVSDGTNLALKLKAGTITQGDYDSQVSALSAIDNRSQISKYLLQRASNQQYSLSVSGGANNSNYYYSASYSRENTNTLRNYGERLTIALNNSWKLFNWATLSSNLKGNFFKYSNNGISLSTLYNSSRFTLLPYNLLADANGNSISYDRLNPDWTSTLSSAYKDWRYNYLDELNNADNKQKIDNYAATVNLQIPLIKGITASAMYTIERSYGKVSNYYNQNTYYLRDVLNFYTYPTATTNSLGITNGGALSSINTVEDNQNMRAQLDFDHTFKKIHQVTALAGIELRETNIGQGNSTLWGYNPQTGLTNSSINYSNTATYPYAAGYSATSYTTFYYGGYPSQADKRRRFMSYYSNAAYTLRSRYLLSVSVRYDDYNNFGLDRKYRATPLWSSGLKWILSKEAFIERLAWINNLSVRATYGVNGNLSLSTYPFTYIALNSSDPTTGQSNAGIISTANPQLKWEKVYVTNAGVDFSLFDRRLNGSLDVYRKNSKDLLYSFPISSVYVGNVNSGNLTRNAASMVLKGLDLGLNGIVYTNEDWEWNVGGTFSYNTNEVTDTRFKESNYSSYYGYYPYGIGLLNGYPTDKLLVYKNAGLDEKGLTQVYDEKGGIIKASVKTISSFGVFKNAGRTRAPYFGNWNTNLKYKQFSLYAFVTYQFGSVFLKQSISNYATSNYSAKYDLSADIAKRWKASGDETTTKVPGINGSVSDVSYSLYRYQYSDINVLPADYIRLRQVSLNYSLPKQLLNKYHIRSAQLGFSVNNLGLLWKANKEGYDPDFVADLGHAYSLPASRSYSFSLNINF